MATTTTYYNLPKNETSDDTLVALVSNQNSGMDIIDGTMKSLDTDIDIINTAVSDTGLVNAMVVNTAGTFDMAKNGNVTPFIIPLFTNTGTATLSMDGGAVTGIRKADDTGTLVVLEAGDIKKNVPTQFVLDTVSGFFVYAPKGGSNIKSIQRGLLNATSPTNNITISTIDASKSIARLTFKPSSTGVTTAREIMSAIHITSNINLQTNYQTDATVYPQIAWEVKEYKKIKSKQSGLKSATGHPSTAPTIIDITVASVDLSKVELYCSFYTSLAANTGYAYNIEYYMLNSTTIRVEWQYFGSGDNLFTEWQLIEHI